MSRNNINLGDMFNPDELDTIIDVDISSGGATGLQQVAHDETMIGDGTAAHPLGVDTTKFISQAGLDTEIQERTDADTALQTQIDSLTIEVSNKQDTITDLSTIRSGAALGATAVQPADVGNATIIIKQGGTNKGSFTLNQKTDTTIELDSGGTDGQPKSTANYSLGNSTGTWTTMTTAQQDSLNSGATSAKITSYDNHIANKNNPHEVTKAQVGLGNVDNTSDANKPVSTAVQTALDNKQPKSTSAYSVGNASGGWTTLSTEQKNALDSGVTSAKITSYDSHLTNKTNPHEVTKAQVGLGNVDNTSDANKPISTATQTALDNKQPKSTAAYQLGNASGTWTALTTAQQDALNSGATTTNITQITTNQTAIATEKTARENADDALQDQIDVLTSKSDVVDVVGTYAELQAYPTSTLHNNDVVKVISDSTHNSAPSYYRWVITGTTGAWTYIGSLADSYTKAETNALLNAKQDNLTTAQLAAVNSGVTASTVSQVATNTTAIAGKQDALTTAQMSAVNSGVTTSTVAQVATNTTAIAGKQDTLTAGTNITITGTTISATDTTYTGSNGITLTGTNFTNSGVRSIAQGATNGTISVNTNGTSAEVAVKGLGSAAYTASTAYATSAQGGKADTAVQPADLATVATSGSYNDLTNKPTIPAAQVNSDWNASSGVAQILNKPTIPTVNDSTITIKQGTATKGTFTLNQATGATITLDEGGGDVALNDLTDVTITTASNGQVLSYNGTKWVNTTKYAMQIIDHTA